MKLLKEISDSSLQIGSEDSIGKTFELRKSARVILENNAGEIAIQYLTRDDFHKLPGGGFEDGESLAEALKREVLEEVGCAVEILNEIGVVIEYRREHALIHISYCYRARVVGEIGEPKLEDAEIAEGTTTVWMKPERALSKMESDTPRAYREKFISERELTFLREYMNQDFTQSSV